jgi:hypothetical protein
MGREAALHELMAHAALVSVCSAHCFIPLPMYDAAAIGNHFEVDALAA